MNEIKIGDWVVPAFRNRKRDVAHCIKTIEGNFAKFYCGNWTIEPLDFYKIAEDKKLKCCSCINLLYMSNKKRNKQNGK